MPLIAEVVKYAHEVFGTDKIVDVYRGINSVNSRWPILYFGGTGSCGGCPVSGHVGSHAHPWN